MYTAIELYTWVCVQFKQGCVCFPQNQYRVLHIVANRPIQAGLSRHFNLCPEESQLVKLYNCLAFFLEICTSYCAMLDYYVEFNYVGLFFPYGGYVRMVMIIKDVGM